MYHFGHRASSYMYPHAAARQLGPVRLPYPVPFRLLGDEAKGWLDTTYLSNQLRISRGNKGTTFILRRSA